MTRELGVRDVVEDADSGIQDYDWDTTGAALYLTPADVNELMLPKRPIGRPARLHHARRRADMHKAVR